MIEVENVIKSCTKKIIFMTFDHKNFHFHVCLRTAYTWPTARLNVQERQSPCRQRRREAGFYWKPGEAQALILLANTPGRVHTLPRPAWAGLPPPAVLCVRTGCIPASLRSGPRRPRVRAACWPWCPRSPRSAPPSAAASPRW